MHPCFPIFDCTVAYCCKREQKKKACILSINVAGFPFGDRSVSELIDFLTHFLGRGVKEFHSYVSKNLDPLLMFYGSTVEHRQGSRIYLKQTFSMNC